MLRLVKLVPLAPATECQSFGYAVIRMVVSKAVSAEKRHLTNVRISYPIPADGRHRRTKAESRVFQIFMAQYIVSHFGLELQCSRSSLQHGYQKSVRDGY